jgi:hypothetical protein
VYINPVLGLEPPQNEQFDGDGASSLLVAPRFKDATVSNAVFRSNSAAIAAVSLSRTPSRPSSHSISAALSLEAIDTATLDIGMSNAHAQRWAQSLTLIEGTLSQQASRS